MQNANKLQFETDCSQSTFSKMVYI